MSLPEVLLWRVLRSRPAGAKFRRQHPSGSYVPDFYCHEARLVIEVDGEAHDRGDRPERDDVRDRWVADRGIKVLRITARDILKEMDAVVRMIEAYVQNPPLQGEVAAPQALTEGYNPSSSGTPLHQPSAGPPPLAGED